MINSRISREYAELATNLTIAEARASLAGRYGVVWDENGRLATLIKLDDLATFADAQLLGEFLGQLPPIIIVTNTETMEAFVQNPAFVAIAIGARGAVVYEDENVTGILTEETITRYLQDEFEPVGETKGSHSDSRLPGGIMDKPLIMYCGEFKHRNELKYYNRHKPPRCQVNEPHPHPIRR